MRNGFVMKESLLPLTPSSTEPPSRKTLARGPGDAEGRPGWSDTTGVGWGWGTGPLLTEPSGWFNSPEERIVCSRCLLPPIVISSKYQSLSLRLLLPSTFSFLVLECHLESPALSQLAPGTYHCYRSCPSLTLMGTHHIEGEVSPLWFEIFLSDKSPDSLQIGILCSSLFYPWSSSPPQFQLHSWSSLCSWLPPL